MSGRRLAFPPAATLVALGFSSTVVQALLLREAMAALSGSEMAWGAVLFAWLVGMAAGARAGVRLGTVRFARTAPFLVLILGAGGVLLFRAAPVLAAVGAGVSLTTWRALWLWIAAVLPAAAAGGLAFPILAHELPGTNAAGNAYVREAAGALVGGVVFTFVLAPWGTAVTLVLCSALTGALQLARRHLVAALLSLAAGIAVAGPAASTLAHATWRWSGRPGRLAAWRETRDQRLELAAGEPAVVYADGRLLASFPDPWGTIPQAHLLMLLHPAPRRILATGVLADGALIPMLEHPVRRIDIAEEDPELPDLLASWYGHRLRDAIRDPRVVVHPRDPIATLSRGGTWDLIALLDPDPSTIRRSRTRTVEFYRRCREHLSPEGILVVRVGVPDTYVGGAGGRLLAITASSLRTVFSRVAGIPGEHVLIVAGGPEADLDLSPDTLVARWRARDIADPSFPPDLITVLLDPDRALPLSHFLQTVQAPTNTIFRPRAVLVAAALTEGRGQPPLLRIAANLGSRSSLPLAVAVVILASVLVIRSARGSPFGVESAAVVGLSSMAWWLLLLAQWQATVGSVFSEVGALSAAFMAGLALSAHLAGRQSHPEKLLPWALAAGGALSLVLTSPAVLSAPRIAIPVLLGLGGGLTGAAFPGAAALAGLGSARTGSGRGFAADEAGAGLAAITVGLIALPWIGLTATAIGIAGLDIATAAACLVAVRRRSPGLTHPLESGGSRLGTGSR